jgi:hypothetical protein
MCGQQLAEKTGDHHHPPLMGFCRSELEPTSGLCERFGHFYS